MNLQDKIADVLEKELSWFRREDSLNLADKIIAVLPKPLSEEENKPEYCECDYFGSLLFKPNPEYTKCLTCRKLINQTQTYREESIHPKRNKCKLKDKIEKIDLYIDWTDVKNPIKLWDIIRIFNNKINEIINAINNRKE